MITIEAVKCLHGIDEPEPCEQCIDLLQIEDGKKFLEAIGMNTEYGGRHDFGGSIEEHKVSKWDKFWLNDKGVDGAMMRLVSFLMVVDIIFIMVIIFLEA